MNTPPTEQELHGWVDDALEPARRAEIDAWLASHPEDAARAAAWRRDAETLRSALAGSLTATVPARLDPLAVRARRRARSRVRWLAAASLLLTLGLGGVGGWQAHTLALARPPMADAVEAYRVFAGDTVHPVEMGGGDARGLQDWLSARLGRPTALPDLRGDGFELLGGRLLSTPDGPAAMVLYQDQRGQRISLYIRQSEHIPAGTQGSRRDGGLLTHYWYRDGYGFAVVSHSDDPRSEEVQKAIRVAT
jgi:anti-sigma factor RsiW